MWRPRLPWDRSLEGPGGCAHVRANETGGQGRAKGRDGRDTGLSQCPPWSSLSELRVCSAPARFLRPRERPLQEPVGHRDASLRAAGAAASPQPEKATLRPVSASMRLGREAGTRPSSFWTEAAPSKERREDGRSHARGRAAEAGGNRRRLCPLGAGGCHAAAQGAAGRAGPRRARPGSGGRKPSTRRREGVGGAEPRDRPGAPRLGEASRPCPARGDHPRARAQPSQSSRGISGWDPPALRVRRGDARPSAKPAGPGTGRTAGTRVLSVRC